MKKSKISVIIPAYNVEPYVKNCINSVLEQTHQDFEIIVVNDGSTDATPSVLDEFARTDARIKVFHQVNGGASQARNTGLSNATGQYVCFVDGDDVITRNMLSEMLRMIESAKADVCVCGIRSFRSLSTVPKNASHADQATLSSREATEALLYEKGILNSQCAKLYSRAIIAKTRFQHDIAFGEDMYFNYTVFRAANNIVLSPFTPYYYLQRSGSAMRSSFNKKRADSLLAAKKIQAEIMSLEGTDLQDAAINKMFTESVAIAGLMPLRDHKTPLFLECMEFIDENKSFVFKNPRTGRKNKLFSLIAMINKPLLVTLLLIRNNIRRKVG